MARYAAELNGSVSTTPDSLATIGDVGSTSPVRCWIYDFMVGFDGTPADNEVLMLVRRYSTSPTGTSVTAAPLDSADAAAGTDVRDAITVEPTFGTVGLLNWSMNQRATYRWVAAPGGELVVPATNVAGVAFTPNGPTGAGNAQATVHFYE